MGITYGSSGHGVDDAPSGTVQPTYTAKGLGKAIGDARRAAGLTQQELCAKADLAYSTLAKIERGAIKTPSVFTVYAVAAATGKTIEELITGESAPQPKQRALEYKTSQSGIKFVYFDINGVMVRFFHRAFSKIAQDTGASATSIESTFWHYNDAVCRGEMSLSEGATEATRGDAARTSSDECGPMMASVARKSSSLSEARSSTRRHE